MTDDNVFERPAALLDGVAADAFEAFNAMQMTKQRHYTLLSRLEEKRARYGLAATSREQVLLAALLADHDGQVARFSDAGRALKNADPEAHRQLFGYIGVIGDADTAETVH